jgi:ABC-type Fe3+/spermidine/putrescine transport system ATPase subunit
MVMSDRIALLRSGELEQIATPREIYSQPATAYVAQFIGHTNLLQCEVRQGTVHCGALSWPAKLAEGPALFSLRPESIQVASATKPATPSNVRVRGRLLQQAFHGATELIRVQCPGGLVLTVRTPSGAGIPEEVDLEFSPASAVPVRQSPGRN